MGDAGPGHAGRSKCSRRRRRLGLVESQYLLKSARVTLSTVQFGPKMGDFAQDRYERSARPTDEDALRRRASLPPHGIRRLAVVGGRGERREAPPAPPLPSGTLT